MNEKFVKFLKGGSLASTSVIEVKGKEVVQKKITLNHNREYGYYRWQSQLRILLSYSNRWPDLFPEILDYGVNKEYAFYTIPYYGKVLNAYDFLIQKNLSSIQLKRLSENILSATKRVHKKKFGKKFHAWELYYAEEIAYAMNSIPKKILSKNKVSLNGKLYLSLNQTKAEFYKVGESLLTNLEHSEVHGNLTLENILVSPNLSIMFIDPYFEVGVSTPLGDYAQLLQSSNSQYEKIMNQVNNNNFKLIDKYSLILNLPHNSNLEFINKTFIRHINLLDKKAYLKVRWLEISQFIRMLPFKFASNIKAGEVIYIYTCKIVEKFIEEYNEMRSNV